MKHFNRKIKGALLILVVCLIAFVGFSKAGILFSVRGRDVITVSTTKKTFDPNNYVASVAITTKQETENQPVETTTKKVTTEAKKIVTTESELSYNGQTIAQIGAKLNERFKGSLAGMGETLARLSVEKGMDPYLLAAISAHETAYGQSNAALYKYNFGGIMCSGKLCSYSSIEDGLTSFVNMVYRNYFSKGLTTAEAMNSKYAASTSWAAKVNALYDTLKN